MNENQEPTTTLSQEVYQRHMRMLADTERHVLSVLEENRDTLLRDAKYLWRHESDDGGKLAGAYSMDMWGDTEHEPVDIERFMVVATRTRCCPICNSDSDACKIYVDYLTSSGDHASLTAEFDDDKGIRETIKQRLRRRRAYLDRHEKMDDDKKGNS